MDHIAQCAELVKKNDQDHFLISQFAAMPEQTGIWALYAFNLQIASIPDMVSEEMIGHIRFAWWREALDELYAGKPGRQHEVVQGLAPWVQTGRLERAYFDKIIEARQTQFATQGIASLQEFHRYAENTEGALLSLCTQLYDSSCDADILRKLAVGYATLGHIRALPFYASRGKVFLPQALLEQHGVTLAQLQTGEVSQGLCDAVRTLLEAIGDMPDHLAPLHMAYRTFIRHYRKRLLRAEYNPFDPRLNTGRNALLFKLLLSSLRMGKAP